jgi:hypothetical protein
VDGILSGAENFSESQMRLRTEHMNHRQTQ